MDKISTDDLIISFSDNMSVSSSEADNITVDSGVYFDHNSEYLKYKRWKYLENVQIISTSPNKSATVAPTLLAPPPPPPPPYQGSHIIVSDDIYRTNVKKVIDTSDIPRQIGSSENGKKLSEELQLRAPRPVNNETNRRSLACCSARSGTTEEEHIRRGVAETHKSHTADNSRVDSALLGTCHRCQQVVWEREKPCVALGQLYHGCCFVCCCCKRSLRGDTFYKDGPSIYCETDYLVLMVQQLITVGVRKCGRTCSSCYLPITDRILEANGHNYHPQCFTCCVCHKGLDGIPFSQEPGNTSIFCIPDFHQVFAPRCTACRLPITPSQDSDDILRVVINNLEFHIDCYRCQMCQSGLVNNEGYHMWTVCQRGSLIGVRFLCGSCYSHSHCPF